MVAAAAFTLLLVGACVSDLRRRRIPNHIVAALVIGGIGYALATMAPLAALQHALGGSAVGLALWLPWWLVRVLGAGDVKLAAASGAWLGAAGMVEASLLAALVGECLHFGHSPAGGSWKAQRAGRGCSPRVPPGLSHRS